MRLCWLALLIDRLSAGAARHWGRLAAVAGPQSRERLAGNGHRRHVFRKQV